MDEILKAASVGKLEVSDDELAVINQCSMKELTAEDVFVFKLAVCGNDIDRDFEAFPTASLEKLAELLKGKTIISNHSPKSENQVARIYATEVVQTNGMTKSAEPYAQLVAHCYMAKTGSNKDFITEIEAGIKKEVSVGCSVANVICSICGTDNRSTICQHKNGVVYSGQTCYKRLENPTDAYEVSFVAIPAQKEAGVIKSYGGKPISEPTPEHKPTMSEKFKSAFNKTEE